MKRQIHVFDDDEADTFPSTNTATSHADAPGSKSDVTSNGTKSFSSVKDASQMKPLVREEVGGTGLTSRFVTSSNSLHSLGTSDGQSSLEGLKMPEEYAQVIRQSSVVQPPLAHSSSSLSSNLDINGSDIDFDNCIKISTSKWTPCQQLCKFMNIPYSGTDNNTAAQSASNDKRHPRNERTAATLKGFTIRPNMKFGSTGYDLELDRD